MRRALLISRNPVEGFRLAAAWAQAGDPVTAVAVDAASAWVRPGHRDSGHVVAAVEAGVTVLAHDEALARRAVTQCVEGVKSVDLDEVADLIAEDADRVVWM